MSIGIPKDKILWNRGMLETTYEVAVEQCGKKMFANKVRASKVVRDGMKRSLKSLKQVFSPFGEKANPDDYQISVGDVVWLLIRVRKGKKTVGYVRELAMVMKDELIEEKKRLAVYEIEKGYGVQHMPIIALEWKGSVKTMTGAEVTYYWRLTKPQYKEYLKSSKFPWTGNIENVFLIPQIRTVEQMRREAS